MSRFFYIITVVGLFMSCGPAEGESSPPAENKDSELIHDDLHDNTLLNEEPSDYNGIGEMELFTEELSDEALTEVHFTELWIWEYLDDSDEWRDMWIFREPNLNYWLFERQSSYGMSSEMCEWVLAMPSGEYLFSFQQAEMNSPNVISSQHVQFYETDSLRDIWKATGEKREFGDPAHGWPAFKGEGYQVFYPGQKDPSYFFLGTGDIDMRPVYYFNHLDGDIQLPISFPTDIPDTMVVLSEETDFEAYNLSVKYRFKEISPNSYYVYLPQDE